MGSNFAAFTEGLGTFLIGVTMVFAALLLLIALILIIGKVVSKIENKPSTALAELKTAVAEPVESVEEEVVELAVEDELELVAVITASIAASLNTTSDKLKIRSLRKVNRRIR